MNLLHRFAIFVFALVTPAFAEELGTAAGRGVIQRFISGTQSGETEPVQFTPLFSFAYQDGSGDKGSTWIVLTDKEPPIAELMKPADRVEARRAWCGSSKASFVALKLDSKSAVDLFYLCPGDGSTNVEMLSSMNGLDSIVLKFTEKTKSRLKGSLTGGQGSCPDAEGHNAYCEQTSNYTFDAPLVAGESRH